MVWSELRYDAANQNEPEPSLATESVSLAFGDAAKEVTRAEASPTEANVEESASGDDRWRAVSNPRVRDATDVVAGFGLGAIGGLATLAERLVDGFLDGPSPSEPTRSMVMANPGGCHVS